MTESEAFVHAVTGSTLHNLWHHHLCHSDKFCTDNIDKVTDGAPSLCTQNPFFPCHDYNAGKTTAKIKGYNKSPIRATLPGGIFNMDYDFVRGEVVIKQEDGPLITSKEGYDCYLIIVDEYSCHILVFLFAGKSPPTETITKFLDTHELTTGLHFIRTD